MAQMDLQFPSILADNLISNYTHMMSQVRNYLDFMSQVRKMNAALSLQPQPVVSMVNAQGGGDADPAGTLANSQFICIFSV